MEEYINNKTVSPTHGFDVAYKIDELLFDKQSAFQHICIIENCGFGRMLFIDDDLQIAQSDAHLYNEAMLKAIVENNCTNNVLILGCGDGGVLNQLLTHKPKQVTMIDIDEEVILASKLHLKSICGEAFDDPRVNLVIGDAFAYIEQEHNFDAIVYDLTADPVRPSSVSQKDFLSQIFSNISSCLKSNGVVSLQCCSDFDVETLNIIKEVLALHFTNLRYEAVYIPSYCEPWVFASGTKAS